MTTGRVMRDGDEKTRPAMVMSSYEAARSLGRWYRGCGCVAEVGSESDGYNFCLYKTEEAVKRYSVGMRWILSEC